MSDDHAKASGVDDSVSLLVGLASDGSKRVSKLLDGFGASAMGEGPEHIKAVEQSADRDELGIDEVAAIEVRFPAINKHFAVDELTIDELVIFDGDRFPAKGFASNFHDCTFSGVSAGTIAICPNESSAVAASSEQVAK